MDETLEINSAQTISSVLWQPAQENTVLSPKPIHFGH
jgi:hypothetical protein